MTGPESDPGRVREVDRAALLGAALAAIVALTFGGEGQWDWLASLSGAALLAIVTAFFHLPAGGRRRHAELVAMAAVVGLAGALVLAAPLQAVLSATAAAAPCRGAEAVAVAEVRATAPETARLAAEAAGGPVDDVLAAAATDRGRSAYGTCIGAVTSGVLWIPALVVSVLVIVGGEVRLRRPRRTD